MEKAANSIAKRVPLALPEAGLYQANLMSRDGDKATPRMIKDLDGLALVYPKGETVQHWGVWVDHQVGKVETNSQWLGQADQKADKDGIYPVQLIRNSERLGTSTALSSVTNDHNLITFQDQPVIDLQGKEIKRWVFDFTRTGTKFSDNSPIYSGFSGHVAVTALTTKAVTTASWSATDSDGFSSEMVGKVDTTNNGGKLTVAIEFPAAGCTLVGEGSATAGLSKLTMTGFGKCNFKQSAAATPIENLWNAALARAMDNRVAYVTTFTADAKKEALVIGFPDTNGLLITADKRLEHHHHHH
uniref:immune modulator A n=1 Tax=Aeromonas veronii Hm21 TaxID=1347420 RepID=UPI000E6E5C1F|nr:Chain A, immune modulator A [Aeromonas veronii Hm21]